MGKESASSKAWGLVFLLLVGGLVVGIGVLVMQRMGGRSAVELAVESENSTVFEVHLSGAVAHEGVYDGDEQSTLGDLLDVAGGVTGEGPCSRLDLHVGYGDEAVVSEEGGEVGEAGTEDRLNINRASLEELQTLRGIGKTKAQAIVDYRAQVGFFHSVDELAEVQGIGVKTVDDLRDQVTVVD